MMENSNNEPKLSQLSFPYFGIQCDWEDALRNPGGTSWVTVRRPGQDLSIHGTLKSESSNRISCSEPCFLISNKPSSQYLTIKDQETEFECSFLAPVGIFDGIHKKNIVSMDVSEGGLGVSVCSNNEIKIWETETGAVRRSLDGHLADVYSCRLFPSGIVVLTAGADMCLKIWSAETGECPVTLKGHSRSIMDTAIVDRGRNVVSVSKDGTAKLWDCGESKCLGTLMETNAELNACALLQPSSSSVIGLGKAVQNMSPREIGTHGKLLLIAREDSKVQGLCLASRETIFTVPVPGPANVVIGTGQNTFVVGCQTGEILTFDLRKTPQMTKKILSPTPTPILDILLHPRSTWPLTTKNFGAVSARAPHPDESNKCFWVAKNDGTVVLLNPSLDGLVPLKNKKLIQLTGSDYDPIRKLCSDGNYIYTACRDGMIRKYSINQITKLYDS